MAKIIRDDWLTDIHVRYMGRDQDAMLHLLRRARWQLRWHRVAGFFRGWR